MDLILKHSCWKLKGQKGKSTYAMGRGHSKLTCAYDRGVGQKFAILVLMYYLNNSKLLYDKHSCITKLSRSHVIGKPYKKLLLQTQDPNFLLLLQVASVALQRY